MSHQNKKRHGYSSKEHLFTKKSLDEKDSIIQDKNFDENKSTSYPESNVKSFHRSQKSIDEISENLAVIYQNQDGSLPNMKNFEKTKRVKIVRTFFTFLFFVLFALVLAFGILYFWHDENSGKDDIVLSVTSRETVTIGERVQFQIRYRNPQSAPVSQASITVRYPRGFVFEKSSVAPTNDTNDEWKLGSLNPNEEGVIEITGRVYGSLHEKESLRVFLNYLPAHFSSEFQKVSTFAFTLTESPVKLTVNGPGETTFGATIPIQLTINKNSDFTIGALSVNIVSNNNFVKKSSDPQSDGLSDFSWSLDPSISTTTIYLEGSFLTQENVTSSTTNLIFQVTGYANNQKSGEPLLLSEFIYRPNLLHTALEVRSAINGALSDANVMPGENLNATFVLKNTGQVPLKNIEVAAIFDAPAFQKQSILNWKEIQDINDGVITAKSVDEIRRRGIVTWTSRQISDLKLLAPGKEVRIDMAVPIKDNEVDVDKYAVWNILTSSEVKYELGGEKKLINSNPITLTINSDVEVEVRNEISGSQNETHTITWLLKNTYHPLKDIELSADVFGDVNFDETKLTVPAGTVSFDKVKKVIRWSIPQMPVGVDVNALQFVLETKNQNPTQTQLTSKVKVRAIDEVTQKEIIIAGDEVLLNIPQDAP